MAKQKWYVVWKGRKPGIYTTWDDCKKQTDGFNGASFKGFKTKEEAEVAYYGEIKVKEKKETVSPVTSTYIQESLCVDAACSGNPGVMEYRGVDTQTNQQLFHVGPFPKGTNNLGEFLAIVDGIKYLQKEGKDIPIYSDSKSGIAWVRDKKVNTTLVRDQQTKDLWKRVDEAVEWLKKNNYTNPVYKWDTENWGEIKADFGRK